MRTKFPTGSNCFGFIIVITVWNVKNKLHAEVKLLASVYVLVQL